jgi:hypothetical protein
MNLIDRLKIKSMVNLIISVLERLVALIIKLSPKTDTTPKPKVKPLKKIIDTIDDIVPMPWRKKK